MGWFRAAFNFANFFVSDMAALGMFDAMRNVSRASLWVILACGAAIGFVSYAVNHTLLAVIVHISTPKELRTVLLSSRGILPYEIACGVGATTFSLAPASDRAAILVGWLVLVVALQTLMVQLARRARERLELLQRIIDVAEMERFKIAADLHDGPVSALAGIAMALGERREADELRTVQRELRDLIFQYSPHDLDRQGRLRQEVSEKQAAPLREQGVDVQVAIPDTVPLDRSGLELLHRVCGEALRNVLGHANASHVTVFVAAESDAVLLTISDDGRGFSMQDVARQRASGHFGTRFLEEKATIAGGAFDIRSAPGQGTRVRLNLPIVDSPLVP
jgi:signal transduction histidine kinase